MTCGYQVKNELLNLLHFDEKTILLNQKKILLLQANFLYRNETVKNY